MPPKTWVVVPDLHLPYEDPAFISIVTQVIKKLRPNGGLVQLGDALDWFQLSRFDKDPDRKNTAYEDLLKYSLLIDKWEALLPDGAEFRQLEGNHCARLTKYIWTKAGDILHMTKSVQEMLRFKERNKIGRIRFSYYPLDDFRACRIGDTALHHGYFFNRHVAVTNLDRYPCKFITGHTHRFQWASNGDRWSVTLGHGSLEAKTAHIPAPMGWQQAFGVLTNIDGICHLETVLVKNGKCVFRGENYEA